MDKLKKILGAAGNDNLPSRPPQIHVQLDDEQQADDAMRIIRSVLVNEKEEEAVGVYHKGKRVGAILRSDLGGIHTWVLPDEDERKGEGVLLPPGRIKRTGYGEANEGELPGMPNYKFKSLKCPREDCDQVMTLVYMDPNDPPDCPDHHIDMVSA